ncbi:MAG: AI-2E family transporter [Acidimicrobiia bacterium]
MTSSEGADPPPAQSDALPPAWVMRVSRTSWAFLGFVGAVSVLVLSMAALREIVIPLALSGVVAVWFAPVVDWLARRGLPRSLAAVIAMVLIVGIVVGSIIMVVVGIVDQTSEMDARFDEAVVELQELLDQSNANELVEDLRAGAEQAGPSLRDGAAAHVTTFLDSAAGFASGLVLGLVLLYYLLKDGPEIASWAAKGHTPAATEQNERIFNDAGVSIRSYFKGRTSLAAVQGVAIFLVLAIMGVPLPGAIGIVNFIGAYIPYLGAFIGGAFAVVLALSEGGVPLALWSLGVVLFVNLALENLLEPRLMGTSLNMHPIAVLLVTVAGGALGGIVGLILAAPAVAIGRNLWHELQASGFFGPPPPQEDAEPPPAV